MKTSFISQKFAAAVAAVVAVAVLGGSATARGQFLPGTSKLLPNFDRRPAATQPDAAQQQAHAALAAQLPQLRVEFNPITGSPSFMRSLDGFLTGPSGAPLGGSQLTAAALPVADPVSAFLNLNATLFAHDASVLESARVKRDAITAHSGLRTLMWEQQLDGIPVHGATLIANVTRRGELVSVSSFMLANPAAAADAGTPNRAALQANPALSGPQALQLAASNIGQRLNTPDIVAEPGLHGIDEFTAYNVPGRAYARLVWLPISRTSMRLCWDTIVTIPATKATYRIQLDAETGEAYIRHSLTSHLTDASYNVFTSDSPSPFSPGLQTPGNFQPPLVNRTLVTTSAYDTTASPDGWIPDGGNTTTGNNLDAFPDRNFDSQPDAIGRPVGNPTRVFDFPCDLTLDPTNYTLAATVQFFYVGNTYHDRLYQLGFTESFGNFQQNNFGRGGFGNDRVIAYVQSGADLGIADNAFFVTYPDGINGECNMFVWSFPNPDRDGSLDAEVMMHELTHGTSDRLVGGGNTLWSMQANGLAEGWSDFFPLCLLAEPGDNPNGNYASAAYAAYQFVFAPDNYYFGLRHYPYSTDMSKNPFTFKDVDPAQVSSHPGIPRSPIYPFDPAEATESHYMGEVWCSALWEVRANLVARYGLTAGNQLALQLVTDGLKLTPGYPNFLQARDAIILADRVNNGGANVNEIWRGFAKRGMGVSAYSPNSTTTSGLREAYDIPGLLIDRVVVLGGNDNRVIDPNECDDLQVYLANVSGYQVTGVSATLATTNPAVIVVQPTAPYPVFPNNTTNANITPFRVSVAPYFVCGTPINFTLVVKTDQDVLTNYFTLQTGLPTNPTRFDNNAKVAIPDADLSGTNSSVLVTNFTGAITRVAVSLHLLHTYDQDLTIQLISPDGITNTLSANHGLNGRNYGVGCADNLRTTFDDLATNLISVANPPFIGSFVPDQPLAIFNGKFGTNVNGIWRLRLVDDTRLDAGTLQCWSLMLYTAACTDGGGECPGSDMGVGMSAVPEPVIIGENVTYSIRVTNNGPSSAKNVVVTHLLPSGSIFISGSASQGTVSAAGGVVSANLGLMNARQVVTVSVVAFPTVAGIASSTATVSSEQTDFNSANNSATTTSRVNPPTTDLALGISATPNALVLGQSYSYSLGLTNRGPSTASGIQVTNVLPAGVSYVSTIASQGSVSVYGNTVVCTFGSLTNGGRATATINAIANAEGQLIVNSSVRGNQFDPVSTNNTVAAAVSVGPAADLSVSIVDSPDPVVVRSNFTYVVTLMNHGPSTATGVTLNQGIAPGATIVQTNSTQGTVSIVAGVLTANVGTLAPGASATITVRLAYQSTTTVNSTATVSATQADPNSANNTAAVTTSVLPPIITIAAAGATLTAEALVPPNGAVDIGEQVTVTLRLRNAGNVPTTNLTATLLATNGVAPVAPNTPQSYGVLIPSGFPVGKPFTFVASGTNGGSVIALLALQDGSTTYPPVPFTFSLANTREFSNTNAIAINQLGAANPYPSTNIVSGVSGTVGKVTVTLANFGHTYPRDVNVLLVSPKGQRVLLLSHASNQGFLTGANLVFDDQAASQLPNVGAIASGTWQPTAFAPAPAFPAPAPASPYSSALGAFNSVDPNGPWLLYVMDDSGGDGGAITNGWSLKITTVDPVNQVADLSLAAAASPGSALAGSNVVYTFSVGNAGPTAASVVLFSNSVPAGMTLVSAQSSQGSLTTSGGVIAGNLGNLNSGATATVTVVLNAGTSAAGLITNSAVVVAAETDLNSVNNTAAVVTSVGLPSSDVGFSQALGSQVLVGQNASVTLTVTNIGPGLALDVVVTNPVPAGLGFVSATSSIGTVTIVGGAVVAQLGTLAPQTAATVDIVFSTTATGSFNSTAAVATGSMDFPSANNTATAVVNVANPSASIVSAGAFLKSEQPPANGTIDIDEEVTVALSLKNVGSANTANLTATLLNTGGVTPVGVAQKSYGQLAFGGSSVAQDFTFRAAGPNGGTVTASLQLQDGSTDLGIVTYNFSLPTSTSFSNTASIAVPDYGPANPYPSVIDVAGLNGSVSKVAVTLHGVSHSFPRDLNVLLVSPAGGRVLLMSHSGGAYALTNIHLVLADTAAAALPATNRIVSGSYQPTAYGAAPVFPASAPQGSFSTNLAALNGADPNGAWSLFVLDDSNGDAGVISSGWSLEIVTVNPVNPVTDVSVALAAPVVSVPVGNLFTNVVTISNLGPVSAAGLIATNTFSENVIFVAATTSTGAFVATNSGSIAWAVGDLQTGATATASIVLKAVAPGTALITTASSGAFVDLNTANSSAQASVAIINPAPAVITGEFVGAEFRLTITCEPNATYMIQASQNLTTWTTLEVVTASASGTIKYTDTNPPAGGRFYRTARVP